MARNQVDLTKEDIRNSLIKLSIPMALTAIIQMAYSFVDIIWIGKISTNAVAAVGIVYILFWIGEALGLISKIGMGVYASQAYGRKDYDKTSFIIKNGFILAIILGFCYSFFVFLFRKNFIDFYKLEPDVSKLSLAYLTITSPSLVFLFINPILAQSFYSLGDSKTPFKINTVGLIINIILDPVLIFGLGPFNRLGIRGAAIATVFAQFCVFIIFIIVMKKDRGIVGNFVKDFKFSLKWQVRIFKLGLPASLLSSIHAFITIILNKFMANFGPRPVAVYSIGSEIESITWMMAESSQIIISALVGQNYGAGLIDRVNKSIKEALRLVGIIGIVSTLVLFIFRNKLFMIFVPKDLETVILGGKYLLILSLSQFMMAMEIGAYGIFNGLADTRTPAIISVSLNICRIPLCLLFMPFMGVLGIWFSMTVSSIIKGILAILLLRQKVKKGFKSIKKKDLY